MSGAASRPWLCLAGKSHGKKMWDMVVVVVVEQTANHHEGGWLTGSMWFSMWKRHWRQCYVKCVETFSRKKWESQNTCKKIHKVFWCFILKISTFQVFYRKYKIETSNPFFQYSHYCLKSLGLSAFCTAHWREQWGLCSADGEERGRLCSAHGAQK